MAKTKKREGRMAVSFILVWSSLSPVFILWAIKGVSEVSDSVWWAICTFLALFPTALLYYFLCTAKKSQDYKNIKIHSIKDQKENLLTYLFTILIPFFDVDLGKFRDIIAVFVALLFVIFLFMHMRLHYMNFIFAIFGYKIFTVESQSGTDASERMVTYALLSKRHHLEAGGNFKGWRLGSGNVLMEVGSND